jgi:thymidylate synthase
MAKFDVRGDECETASSPQIQVSTIGAAWLAISAYILERGAQSHYDTHPIREVMLATLVVTQPRSSDQVVHRYADASRLAWMHENFTRYDRVAALGDADSYATRLRDYDHSGRDQIQWVIERLRSDPLTRSATITTFQPLTDTTYIPCVSLLDFYLIDGALHLASYAHSIDFGAKGYGNLVELASLQEEVAGALACAVGTLNMTIKSAHVYESDFAYMSDVLSAQRGSASPPRAPAFELS